MNQKSPRRRPCELARRPSPLGRCWPALLLGALICLAGATAIPAPSDPAPAPGSEASTSPTCLGRVERIEGRVEAQSAAGTRALAVGDRVYVGERVRADLDSEALLQTLDAGILAIRPRAEFVVEAYAAQTRETDHMRLRIVSGSLRLVSGWIGIVNPPGTQILTPAATIRIKGTDYEPYVLPEDLADATPYEAGTYDKVNRGATLMSSAAGDIEVKARQVGRAQLVRTDFKAGERDRSLMTLLLPALLERVPDFYVAGRFEADIDAYSQNASALIKTRLDAARLAAGGTRCDTIAPLHTSTGNPADIARDWTLQLDSMLRRHDADGVLGLFAEEAQIEATGRDGSGQASIQRFGREQFARSVQTLAAGLEAYEQRRETLDVSAEPPSAEPMRIAVQSRVVEWGKLQGRDFRTESDEYYLLERRDGRWLAVRATTTMR